jgi:pimeloyl-ACP methyl ester carboxylesterase
MDDVGGGGTIPVDRAGAVTVPALVLTGGADHPWMTDVGRRLAEVLPQGRHRVMEGQEHVVPPEVLVSVLTGFFVDQYPKKGVFNVRTANPDDRHLLR